MFILHTGIDHPEFAMPARKCGSIYLTSSIRTDCPNEHVDHSTVPPSFLRNSIKRQSDINGIDFCGVKAAVYTPEGIRKGRGRSKSSDPDSFNLIAYIKNIYGDQVPDDFNPITNSIPDT